MSFLKKIRVKHSGFSSYIKARKLLSVTLATIVLLLIAGIGAMRSLVINDSFAATQYNVYFYDSMTGQQYDNYPCTTGSSSCRIDEDWMVVIGSAPHHEGYLFIGFATTPTGPIVYERGDGDTFTVTMSKDIYLYAKYQELPWYMVNFSANGGTGTPENFKCYYSNSTCSTTIPNVTPTYSGRTFQGYALSADAAEVAYQPGDRIETTKDVTLYAIWLPADREALVQHYNGDTARYICRVNKLNGSCQVTLSVSVPRRDQYVFYGYAESPNSKVPVYQHGDTVTLNKNIVLYAIWLPIYTASYDLRYDDYRGKIGTCTADASSDACEIQLSGNAPVRDDYIFLGWTDDENSSEVKYSHGNTATIHSNTTFYAIWQKNEVEIDCNRDALKIEDAVCLQDINGFIKGTMELGEVYELADSRDGNIYRVSKLDDGNIWLLDNLALGNYSGKLLTLEDTNTDPNLNDGEFWLPASGYYYNLTEPVVDISTAHNASSIIEGSEIGGYYNYCAATAGTMCEEGSDIFIKSVDSSDATTNDTTDLRYDICPVGWRMPTGGEYIKIDQLYGTHDTIDRLLLPFAGSLMYSSLNMLGSGNSLWALTYTSNTGDLLAYSYAADIDNMVMMASVRNFSDTNPVNSYMSTVDRGFGQSVRCIVDIKEEGSGSFRWDEDKDGHTVNDNNKLVFIIDLPLRALASVRVDGGELAKETYELKSGSTIITLTPSYLDTLSVGEHTLTARYDSGAEIESNFIIKPAEENTDNEDGKDDDELVPTTGKETAPYTGVNTGDNEGANYDMQVLVAIPATIAILGISGFVISRKKSKIL